jgi:peroxiredoxin
MLNPHQSNWPRLVPQPNAAFPSVFIRVHPWFNPAPVAVSLILFVTLACSLPAADKAKEKEKPKVQDAAATKVMEKAVADLADPQADLDELLEQVKAKLEAGQHTEKELEPELRRFDILLLKHRASKSDDVAQILMAKAMLYFEAFNDPRRGTMLLEQLKTEFPGTGPAKKVDNLMGALRNQEEASRHVDGLVVGAKFPDFSEKDTQGRPFSLSALRGKPVLVTFWASWSNGSADEVPALLQVYKKYRDRGLQVVGISVDPDERDMQNFVKRQGLPWPQYFDGKGWKSKLAIRYSVIKIPTNYLLDAEGKVIGRNLRGPALEAEVAKLLGAVK